MNVPWLRKANRKANRKARKAEKIQAEEYVAVSISDSDSVIWGGSPCACAVGCFYCIGQVNLENNGAIQRGVSLLLEGHGVNPNRIYINYFDVERENCGWSGRTFAG
ncbi:hypothetical protein TrRE_jg2787 [Triparma retinervis]|uniref:Uncharacterized protein n=1 Tax=Triparma retinervis TaxID=2557542 RepID=A0A9W7AEP4_9STRA|nr:hypothetical protein TrRE_jg2787 [Triparma retinervis]